MSFTSSFSFPKLLIEWDHPKPWYQPTFSPEHGVIIILLGAVLTGASLAQAWTWQTSLACLSAFLAMQSEHPLTVQIKQRRSLKPRYIIWSFLYASWAGMIALWLVYHHGILVWIFLAGMAAMLINIAAVYRRKQKTVSTEIILFSAICLSTLFVYGTTADKLNFQAFGLWILNSLFFSSAIFTIKLRKVRTSSLHGPILYHSISIMIIGLLCLLGGLKLLTALTFAIAILKLLIIIGIRDWYCNCRFEHIARFETYFALSYIALTCLSILPAHLPASV